MGASPAHAPSPIQGSRRRPRRRVIRPSSASSGFSSNGRGGPIARQHRAALQEAAASNNWAGPSKRERGGATSGLGAEPAHPRIGSLVPRPPAAAAGLASLGEFPLLGKGLGEKGSERLVQRAAGQREKHRGRHRWAALRGQSTQEGLPDWLWGALLRGQPAQEGLPGWHRGVHSRGQPAQEGLPGWPRGAHSAAMAARREAWRRAVEGPHDAQRCAPLRAR